MLLFKEESKAKVRYGGDGTPSIGHIGEAFAADEGNGGVADHGESRARDAGMIAILAITDIAHIENAILDCPMMAEGLGQALEIQGFHSPATNPDDRFLAAPLTIPQTPVRAAGPAHTAHLRPMQFLFEIAAQFTRRQPPYFTTLDVPMLFRVLRQISWMMIPTQGEN